MENNLIVRKEQPNTKTEVEGILNPTVKQWFYSRFPNFSSPQLFGVFEIHSRNNILVSAPTGATKTLTAFLSILNELVDSAEKGVLQDKVYCVYISPLKALATDIKVNLITPLEQIENIAGKKLGIRVAVRTGDTTQAEKSKMLAKPPHILITTPESLAILLSSTKFRNHLMDVEWCIVDEIHALAENKRGTHLSLSLERLQHISPGLCRVGLSATVAPIDEIANFLVGDRSCKVVDIQFLKNSDLKVLSPVDNLIDTPHADAHHAMYTLIDQLIQEHKTTLIFTNTRSATERVVDHLKNRFPSKYLGNIGTHHGSMSKRSRLEIENKLRNGELKAVVCVDGKTEILTAKGWFSAQELQKTQMPVRSLNMETLRIEKSSSKGCQKLDYVGRGIIIRTRSGKEIKCTSDHKFLTIQNGTLCWAEAGQLTNEQRVATLRNAPVDARIIRYSEFLPMNVYLEFPSKTLRQLKGKIITAYGTIKKSAKNLGIRYSTFLHNLRGVYPIRLEWLKELSHKIDLNLDETILSATGIRTEKQSHYISPSKTISADFARFLGFFLAEGSMKSHHLDLANSDISLITKYSLILEKEFGLSKTREIRNTGVVVDKFSATLLCGILKEMGVPLIKKSLNNSIPRTLFQLSEKHGLEFLSGYLDGDGYVEQKNGRIYSAGLTTFSQKMAWDLHKLLLRYGILSVIRRKKYDENQLYRGRYIKKQGTAYTVAILGGEHLRNFIEQVKPWSARFNKLAIKDGGHCHQDTIPALGKTLRELRNKAGLSTYAMQKTSANPVKYELNTRAITQNQLKFFLNLYQERTPVPETLQRLTESDIYWDEIKEICECELDGVFTMVNVEPNGNYIANGFISKNCSTSLELGIDIGYIDLVICLGSPKSVARFLQRAGRSGHRLSETVKSRIIVMDRDDLVECAVLLKSAIEKKIDRVHIPRNALDVLAQQLIGMALEQVWEERELFKTVKQSYCYKDLKLDDFNQILSYLAGEFAELEDRHIYAKIWREDGKVGKRGKLTCVIYMTNIGTIPDESFITVKVGTETVGMLDEGFVERMKPGDVFVLGGDTYMFKFTRGMVAQVSASVNRPPTVPRWVSEMLPLSFDLANEIGRFRRLMLDRFNEGENKASILKFINEHLYVDDKAANAIYEYFKEQFDYCKHIPNDRSILVEYYQDERDQKIIFHSLFGRRVNDCLSRAIAFAISRTEHKDVELGISDNGFYIAGGKKLNPIKAIKLLKSDKLSRIMNTAIEKSEVFKRRFRHCATRSLMILRNYLGHQKNVGRQQVSSMILMSALKQLDPDFGILKEARRECLEDLMDIENTKKVLEGIEKGTIKLVEIETFIPSPFALNLALQGYADVLRIEDKYEFLHRMHEQILARIAGKNVEYVNPKSFVEGSRVERNEFKEILKREAWNLKRVPKFAKAELVRIIDGERRNINAKFIESVRKYRDEIEKTWPDELKKFLFTVFDDLKSGDFSYEDFWTEESVKEETKVEEEKQMLFEQFNAAAKKINLDPQVRYDVYKMIAGDKEGFRDDTIKWMKSLFSKAVPSIWKDDIAKFLQKKLKELK